MIVSTILISVQNATARLLQNKKKSAIFFICNEFIASTKITALYIRSIYACSGAVMELTAGMSLFKFWKHMKKIRLQYTIAYMQAVHSTLMASHKLFTASDKHRMITHCRQRGVVVRSVVFTTTMIAWLMVHLPT